MLLPSRLQERFSTWPQDEDQLAGCLGWKRCSRCSASPAHVTRMDGKRNACFRRVAVDPVKQILDLLVSQALRGTSTTGRFWVDESNPRLGLFCRVLDWSLTDCQWRVTSLLVSLTSSCKQRVLTWRITIIWWLQCLGMQRQPLRSEPKLAWSHIWTYTMKETITNPSKCCFNAAFDDK